MAASSEGAGRSVLGILSFLMGITQVAYMPLYEAALLLEIWEPLLSWVPWPGLRWHCIHRISWETGEQS